MAKISFGGKPTAKPATKTPPPAAPTKAAPTKAAPTKAPIPPGASKPKAHPMSKTTELPPNPDPDTAAPVGDDTVVPPTTREIAMPTQPGITGDVKHEHLVFPSLKLVQSIGPLSETFDAGIFVLNGEIPISDAGMEAAGIHLTVVTGKLQYVEDVPYGGDQVARVFDTEAEVREAGGWLEWVDNAKPPFAPVLRCLVVIKCPTDELAEHFPFSDGTDNYAPAMYELKGSAFTVLGKSILTVDRYNAKTLGGIHFVNWHIRSNREKRGSNLVWVPRGKRDGVHRPETAEFVRAVALG